MVVEGAAGVGQDHRPGRHPDVLARAGPEVGGGDPDVEGRPDRRRTAGFTGVVGGEADPSARLPVDRRRPLDPAPARRHRPGHRHRTTAVLLRSSGCGRVICCWWTRPGCWTRTPPSPCSPSPTNSDARVALVGDRRQLPAIGRGGVLDIAARWTAPDARVTLDTVHRFTDPAYADLTLAMRAGHRPRRGVRRPGRPRTCPAARERRRTHRGAGREAARRDRRRGGRSWSRRTPANRSPSSTRPSSGS